MAMYYTGIPRLLESKIYDRVRKVDTTDLAKFFNVGSGYEQLAENTLLHMHTNYSATCFYVCMSDGRILESGKN